MSGSIPRPDEDLHCFTLYQRKEEYLHCSMKLKLEESADLFSKGTCRFMLR